MEASTNPFKPQQPPPIPPPSTTIYQTLPQSTPYQAAPEATINQPIHDSPAVIKPYTFKQLFRHYWQEAITYWAVFGTFGMCVAFLGPCLLDIGCLISSGLQSTTWAFTSQLFFSLMGATVAGYVVERCAFLWIFFVSYSIKFYSYVFNVLEVN